MAFDTHPAVKRPLPDVPTKRSLWRWSRSLPSLLIVALMVAFSTPAAAQTQDCEDFEPEDVVELVTLAWEGDLCAQVHAAANFMMAAILDGGADSENAALAFNFTKRAAEQGDVESQTMLGQHYYEAFGTRQDLTEALRWFRRAATNGHPRGQFVLGGFYLSGNIVPQDDIHAYAWLTLAAEQGLEDAQELLNGMNRWMSRAQRQQAMQRARQLDGEDREPPSRLREYRNLRPR